MAVFGHYQNLYRGRGIGMSEPERVPKPWCSMELKVRYYNLGYTYNNNKHYDLWFT
jgi:hypothetical protein